MQILAIIFFVFALMKKNLKRQPREVQLCNEKCDSVSAKAFFNILNFVEFEIEERADDNSFA